MLVDPMIVWREPLPVLATLLIIVLGKSIAAYLIVRLFRYPPSTALTISASLAQIGEFSFILAGLGVDIGAAATERPRPDAGRRDPVDPAQPDFLSRCSIAIWRKRNATQKEEEETRKRADARADPGDHADRSCGPARLWPGRTLHRAAGDRGGNPDAGDRHRSECAERAEGRRRRDASSAMP